MSSVEVRFAWREVGDLRIDASGRPVFPALPAKPGLYRYRLVATAGTTTYIGEASDLRRRAQNYRTPGASQATNLRMNARFREHLAAGGRVEMATVTEAELMVDGQPRALDLGRKASRLLVENAAIHASPEAEPLENLPGVGDRATSLRGRWGLSRRPRPVPSGAHPIAHGSRRAFD